jgi:hypothetical protein
MDPIKEMLKRRYRREQTDNNFFNIENITGNLIVSDDSIINPFIATSEIVDVARRETASCYSKEQKARALYNWVEGNIIYHKRRGYRNSREVFEQREGICGEMTFLYVTMARVIGVEANCMDVKVDYKGEKVKHACARVRTEEGRKLVDPAYHIYDINHRRCNVLSDAEMVEMYKQWRTDRIQPRNPVRPNNSGNTFSDFMQSIFRENTLFHDLFRKI